MFLLWCEALFFDFLFGGPFGQKKWFNADVFLIINSDSFRTLISKENWQQCEIHVFLNIMNSKSFFKYFVKNVYYMKLVHFRAYMRENMSNKIQFSKNRPKLILKVFLNIKFLILGPGSIQIEPYFIFA